MSKEFDDYVDDTAKKLQEMTVQFNKDHPKDQFVIGRDGGKLIDPKTGKTVKGSKQDDMWHQKGIDKGELGKKYKDTFGGSK